MNKKVFPAVKYSSYPVFPAVKYYSYPVFPAVKYSSYVVKYYKVLHDFYIDNTNNHKRGIL